MDLARLKHDQHLANAECSEARARSSRLQVEIYRHPDHAIGVITDAERAKLIGIYTELAVMDDDTSRLERLTAAQLLINAAIR